MVPVILLSLIVLFLSSTAIFVSLGLSGFISIILASRIDPVIVVQRMIAGINTFALMALPFFILAANLMDSGGMSRRLLDLAKAIIGHVSGGIAMATQLASMFFGALSGSSPATIVAIGKIMLPDLLEKKYPPSFIGGLLATSGSVALLIPPSITLIIYGAVTGVSVGKLFVGGITAGLIFGGSSLIYIYLFSKKRKLYSDKRASWSEMALRMKESGWALMVPVIIIGGIYTGIFTPTESAGVSAAYALLIGKFVYKELTFEKIWDIFIESSVASSQLLIMIGAAQILGWVLTVGQVTKFLSMSILGSATTAFGFLMAVNVMLLIVGMFLDGSAAIIILAPIMLPLGNALGIDPVHLGLIMITNLSMGLYTPPFGLNIFVTSAVAGFDVIDMLPGIARFLMANLVALMIITYMPKVIMFLPNLMYS